MRLTRLEIFEYALEGAITERGLQSGNMTEEEEDELDDHIEQLERKIVLERAKVAS